MYVKRGVYSEYIPVDQNEVKKQGIRPMETSQEVLNCMHKVLQIDALAFISQFGLQ